MWEDTEEEELWEYRKRWRDVVARQTTTKGDIKGGGEGGGNDNDDDVITYFQLPFFDCLINFICRI